MAHPARANVLIIKLLRG